MATALATGSDGNDTSDRLAKVEATVARLEERVERLEAVNARLRQTLTSVDDHQAARGGDVADSLGNMALKPTSTVMRIIKLNLFPVPVRYR